MKSICLQPNSASLSSRANVDRNLATTSGSAAASLASIMENPKLELSPEVSAGPGEYTSCTRSFVIKDEACRILMLLKTRRPGTRSHEGTLTFHEPCCSSSGDGPGEGGGG